MNLHFTEEQLMMRSVVRDFARKEISPFIEKMEAGEFPRQIIAKMGELKLMGITIPPMYGGAGMDFISYIIAIHEISKISATVGVILSVHTSVGTNPILYFGTEEQKKRFIPKLATGEHLGAFSLTEPDAGSDAASISARAVKQGDHYLLNGTKVFVTNGGEADIYITFAKTAKGMSCFIVEKNTSGLIIGKDEQKMGLHGSRTVQLMFENMKIPSSQLLGKEGEGFKIALANLNIGRIGIAAQALGIGEAAFAAAKRFANERSQFGKQIKKHQAIAFKLADMQTGLESARLLVYRAADLFSKGIVCTKEVAMAKLFSSKTAVDVTKEAIQIFGGYGYSKEFPVERYFRDAKITEIYEGTSEIQRIVIAKQLLH